MMSDVEDKPVVDAMNVLLLIEHGCSEAWARYFVNNWNLKCEELARERRVSQQLNDRAWRLETQLIETENKLATERGRVEGWKKQCTQARDRMHSLIAMGGLSGGPFADRAIADLNAALEIGNE